MNKHDQNGAINVLLIPLIAVSVLFLAMAGFGCWAYLERQDFKLNSDEKVAAAVIIARQDESTSKDKQFAEAEKNPLQAYQGPTEFGSLVVKYPKTWSAYVDDTGRSGAVVDGYFHPGTVPALTGDVSIFALRVRVLNQSYTSILSELRGQQKSGAVTVEPYSLPQVPNTVGIKVVGKFKSDKTGTTIILPLRDKSIQISTEGGEFGADFTNNILPNLTFAP